MKVTPRGLAPHTTATASSVYHVVLQTLAKLIAGRSALDKKVEGVRKALDTNFSDAETNLIYAGKYLRGAWLVSNGDMDAAVMWYAKGYYYEAKRLGLLEETGLI